MKLSQTTLNGEKKWEYMLAGKLVQHEFCSFLGLLTFFMDKFKYNNKYSYTKLQKRWMMGKSLFEHTIQKD